MEKFETREGTYIFNFSLFSVSFFHLCSHIRINTISREQWTNFNQGMAPWELDHLQSLPQRRQHLKEEPGLCGRRSRRQMG